MSPPNNLDVREKDLRVIYDRWNETSLTDSPFSPFPVRLFPMRTLTAFLCLTFAVLLFSAGEAWSLPKCPGRYQQNTWTNCFGTFTFANGDKYVGEYRDGKKHGQGTLTYSAPNKGAGYKYVGEYRDGKMNGQGTGTYSAPHKNAGFKYVGEFRDGKKHGQGTVTFDAPHKSAGEKFVGEFKNERSTDRAPTHGMLRVNMQDRNTSVNKRMTKCTDRAP